MTAPAPLPAPDRQLRLAALPTAPGVARAFVTAALREWSVPDTCRDDVELLTSELVTNAVERTGRADGPPTPYPTETVVVVGVRVCLWGDCVRLEVWDRDPAPPRPAEAKPDDESGRGLRLVAELSEAWGVRPSRAGGKVVWCEVAREQVAPMGPPAPGPVLNPPGRSSQDAKSGANQGAPDIATLERVLLGLRQPETPSSL